MKSSIKAPTVLTCATCVAIVAPTSARQVEVTLGPVVHVSSDRPDVPHAEVHLALNPTNPDLMIAGAIVMPDGEQSVIEVLYTNNGGRRWMRNTLPEMNTTWGADPWLAFDGQGRPVVSSLVGTGPNYDAGIWLHWADSLGGVWSGPSHVGPGDGGAWDQQKIVIDGRRGRDGGTLIMVGDKWGPRAPAGSSTGSVGLTTVSRGGRGSAQVAHAEAGNSSKSPSAPVLLRDSTVVTLFHEYLAVGDAPEGWIGGLWSIASADGGRSFESRNIVSHDLRPGMIALAADTLGELDLLYAMWPSTAGSIQVATSGTRGERWSVPVSVGPLTARDVAGVSVAVDGRGVFAALWNVAADSPEGSVCRDTWFAISSDRGQTFTEPVTLQEGASCVVPANSPTFTVDGNVNRTYDRFARGGEYFGLVGLPSGGFYAIWIDATTGEQQMMGRRVRVN